MSKEGSRSSANGKAVSTRRADRAVPVAHRGAALTLSLAWRILALVAFVVQCTLVQSHVHPAERVALPQTSALTAGQAQTTSAGERIAAPDNCLLCWEAAMAGNYLLPAAAVHLPPPTLVVWIVAPSMAAFAVRPLSHAWLSRAPPQ